MATGMCWPKYQIFYVLKIKVVFTPSSYNVSASCSIIYNQTVCLFQYIQVRHCSLFRVSQLLKLTANLAFQYLRCY